MTPDMVAKARTNARKGSYKNVEFRLGEIEHLPLADASVDVIISNCVINLSTDKPGVFREAYRVLKRGGRLAVSGVVATARLPDAIRNDLALYSTCGAGAKFQQIAAPASELTTCQASVRARPWSAFGQQLSLHRQRRGPAC